jgi:hypothetical protein
MATQQPQEVEHAIAELKSFRDGDLGVLHVIACGDEAIPALRTVLFQREPSGLYQPRCRAVEALAALDAYNVLIEFLEIDRRIADRVERLGEDAVINAAALVLANKRDAHIFGLLLRLARRACLTGVIGALGAFRSAEAIPALINALEEDASRLTAENALRKLGERARTALLHAADQRLPSRLQESESSVRRRRSALRLLADIGIRRRDWASLRPLLQDHDPNVAVLACRICFAYGPVADWGIATRSLIVLLAHEDWILRENAESCLAMNFAKAQPTIEAYLHECWPPADSGRGDETASILHRVTGRARVASNTP